MTNGRQIDMPLAQSVRAETSEAVTVGDKQILVGGR